MRAEGNARGIAGEGPTMVEKKGVVEEQGRSQEGSSSHQTDDRQERAQQSRHGDRIETQARSVTV